MSIGTSAPPVANPSATRSIARWVLLTVVLFLVVFFRNPEVLVSPSLEAEDGTFVFPHFYADRDLTELMRFQAGYIPLVLNLIAYVSVRLPTTLIPYGFAIFPFILALFSYLWLFARRFRPWLGSDSLRATICVLFALAPLAQYHIYANATYSIWSTLLLFVLLAVTPAFATAWRNAAVWIAANVLAWSNPLTILAAPILAIRLFRDRCVRLPCLLTMANLFVYNAIGVEKGGIFAGLTWVESLQKLAKAVQWTFMIVVETAFRTAFGTTGLKWAATDLWPLVAAWAIVITTTVILAARQSPRLRIVLCLLGYIIFGFTFVSFLSRGQSMIPLDGAPRYIYVQTFAFLIIYALLIDYFFLEKRRGWRIPVLGALVAWYFALNVQLGHYFFAVGTATRSQDGLHSPYVQSQEGNGLIVRQFFAELARLEKQNGSRKGIDLSVDKPADWPIVIDTRDEANKP